MIIKPKQTILLRLRKKSSCGTSISFQAQKQPMVGFWCKWWGGGGGEVERFRRGAAV
jgi:hypothetical protein